MASVDQVWAGLVNQIETAMQGTNLLVPLLNTAAYPNGAIPYPQPGVVIDWPPIQTIGAVSQGTLPTVISVYDRGSEKNDTHAIPLFYALPQPMVRPEQLFH